MLDRLGQQSGLTTNASENVVPRFASSSRTCGMAHSVSHRWSSVTINRMLGRVADPSRFTAAVAAEEPMIAGSAIADEMTITTAARVPTARRDDRGPPARPATCPRSPSTPQQIDVSVSPSCRVARADALLVLLRVGHALEGHRDQGRLRHVARVRLAPAWRRCPPERPRPSCGARPPATPCRGPPRRTRSAASPDPATWMPPSSAWPHPTSPVAAAGEDERHDDGRAHQHDDEHHEGTALLRGRAVGQAGHDEEHTGERRLRSPGGAAAELGLDEPIEVSVEHA